MKKSENKSIRFCLNGEKGLGFSLYSFLYASIAFLTVNCESNTVDPSKIKPLEGPTIKTFDIHMIYTDSGKVRTEMRAPLRLEYKNGDETYPNGITLDFYNVKGVAYTHLTAKKARKLSQENKYTATGNVVVRNTEENQQLNTEELNWTPSNHQLFTEAPVTITTEKEILKGKGMTAKQDFSAYKIKFPTGKFTVEKE